MERLGSVERDGQPNVAGDFPPFTRVDPGLHRRVVDIAGPIPPPSKRFAPDGRRNELERAAATSDRVQIDEHPQHPLVFNIQVPPLGQA